MPTGLQIFDASGNIILDDTYRVMRIVGNVYLAGTSGSTAPDPRMTQGGFISFQPQISNGEGYLSGGIIVPRFSIDGSTGVVSWTYPAPNNTSFDVAQKGTLFYGAS